MSFDLQIGNGDLVIGSNGDLQQIQDTDKLIQDILKIVTTPIGGNPFFPYYGCAIASMVGGVQDQQFITTMVGSQLQNSLATLQKLQQAQQASGQTCTPAELLAAVQSVTVQRNPTDLRFYQISIKVLTRAMTSQTAKFNVRF